MVTAPLNQPSGCQSLLFVGGPDTYTGTHTTYLDTQISGQHTVSHIQYMYIAKY